MSGTKCKAVFLSVSLVSLMMYSCASAPPAPVANKTLKEVMREEIPGKMARLVIGRPNMFAGAAAVLHYEMNSTKVAVLGNGQYTWLFVEPGAYRMKVTNSTLVLGKPQPPMEFKATIIEGKTTYMEFKYGMASNPEAMFPVNKQPILDYEKLKGLQAKVEAIYQDGSTVPIGGVVR